MSDDTSAFQDRVAPWMEKCFGPEISNDRLERGDRLLEEALELLQSGDYPRERVAALTEYTFNRAKGEPFQEVGGVMVTLAAYCLAHNLNMHDAAEAELARIWTKVDKIRAKQAAKPVGSALPVAAPSPAESNNTVSELVKRLRHRIANDTEVSPYSLMGEAATALASAESRIASAVELLETLNEWFAQREAGETTTNSEAVMFREVNGRLDLLAPPRARSLEKQDG